MSKTHERELCNCADCEAVTAKAIRAEIEDRYAKGFSLGVHDNPRPNVSPEGHAYVAGWAAGKAALDTSKRKAAAYALGVIASMSSP